VARVGLQSALLSSAKGQGRAPAAVQPAPERAPQPAPQASRIGKTNVTGYFPPEVKASLRLVQAKRGGTIQDILAEALNDIFAKYHVPETAPREPGQ
jgi:hypothetical protein